MRVQIPAYADAWMQGDRYGEVIKTLDRVGTSSLTIYHVKLDKSGRTKRYIADDCQPVD